MPPCQPHAPFTDGTGHGQVEEVVNNAIPVADEEPVCCAKVWLTLLSVELHEASHIAIFLESNKEVHYGGEGEDCKDYRESRRGLGWM